MFLFNKTFKIAFLFIFLVELFSFFGYLLPTFNKATFLIIALLALILAFYKLEYGIWILLAELFIGSKGYLFYWEQDGSSVSIRMALWLIVMSVWVGKKIAEALRNKKINPAPSSPTPREWWDIRGRGGIKIEFLKSPFFSYFLIFFLFLGWGLLNGILKGNGWANIFFDFNNWLYFALIFPLFDVINSREKFKNVLQIFIASISWLSLKTFFLLFIFSHNLIGMVYELYRWVRTSGVGEITQMLSGFVRIFFQSHIFVLIGFFIFLIIITNKIINYNKLTNKPLLKDKNFYLLLSVVSCQLSVILITFSRSFWVGLFITFLFYCFLACLPARQVFLKWKISWKKFFITNGILLVGVFLSFITVFAIVKFPYPKPTADFGAEFLSERMADYGEAGVASRWALLPALWQKIKEAPLLGEGFGATVTYKTSDLRVLQSSPAGEYTTYAFEWGWLDIWLKLGIFGLLAYLIFIVKITRELMSALPQNSGSGNYIGVGLALGMVAIIVVNAFSPYLNHPLGIGFVILAAVAAHLRE